MKQLIDELETRDNIRVWSDEASEEFLRQNKAKAMYVPGEPGKPGVLVFSRNATHAEIIEELKHLKQHQALGYKALSASEMIEMEVRAHEDMLVYAKREGWTPDEIDELKRNSEYWQNTQKKYQSDAEFKKKMDEEMVGLTAKNHNIPGNMVDGVFVSNQENTLIGRFISAGHTNLTEVEIVRTARRLEGKCPGCIGKLSQNTQLEPLRTIVNYDLVRYERLLNQVHYAMTKLHNFWARIGSNRPKFELWVDVYIDAFSRLPVNTSSLPRYFSNPGRVFEYINIQHILDKHCMMFFDFFKPQNMINSVHMFGPGIDQKKILDYIDEALSQLYLRNQILPLDGMSETLTLKNGLVVVIGANTNPLTGKRYIGMFYPISGPDVIHFDHKELESFKNLY